MEEEERIDKTPNTPEQVQLVTRRQTPKEEPIHRARKKPHTASKFDICALIILSSLFLGILIALWNLGEVKPESGDARRKDPLNVQSAYSENESAFPEFSGKTTKVDKSLFDASRDYNVFRIQLPSFTINAQTEVCFGPFFMPCPKTGCAVIGYKANPSKYVHHMILQAMHGEPLEPSPVPKLQRRCKNGDYDYAFAWAAHEGADYNQFELDLPGVFEYRVSPDRANAQHFVLDVHFSGNPTGVDAETSVDVKWVDLAKSHRQPSHSTILLIAPIHIPARQKAYTLCSEQRLMADSPLIWFGQRVHAHHSGRRIQTHVYRDGIYIGATGENSQIPQVFRNLDTPRILHPGDLLQVTCTYNTEDKDFATTMGLDKMRQEMCNHYLLYGPIDYEPPTRAITADFSTRQCTFKEKETNSFVLNPDFKVQFSMGPPTAIAEDSEGKLWLFHRGEFVWKTSGPNSTPIKAACILQIDPQTGNVLKHFGENMFLMPHGLYIDGNDTIWVTDVGRHQVLQLDMEGNVLMTLGEEGKQGSGAAGFNMPTDVVRDSEGRIYVSDGYGNARVALFTAEGKFLREWGKPGKGDGYFRVPHSITMDFFGRFYVADRENSRIQFYTPGSGFSKWESKVSKASGPEPWRKHLSAVHFSEHLGVLLAIDGPMVRILDREGNDVAEPFGEEHAEWPHDVIASRQTTPTGIKTIIYVVHLDGKKVLAYEREVALDDLKRGFRPGAWGRRG